MSFNPAVITRNFPMKSVAYLRAANRFIICVLLVPALAAPSLLAQGRKKNPTSKIYVADVEGSAQIDTGETITDLTKRSVYSAQGTVIETKEDATNAMVWSNGTGIYFDPSTRLEVKKFVQEPFTPNRNDMEVEPSISNTETYLSRGVIGLCTSKLVAGSSMNYNTPQASIRIKGRKAVIEVTAEGTKVSLIEGDVTVRAGSLDSGGQTIKPGQQALISLTGVIRIQNIPDNEVHALEDKVTMACMARKTVYFDAQDKNETEEDVTAFDETGAESDQEIVAVEVTPSEVSPIITVSAATIPKP